MKKKERIFFLIDDDKDDIEIFELALKKIDPLIRFFSADNGYKALEKLKSDEQFIPDFIFLDLDMPVMNGKACIAEIKNTALLKNIPVYIYTTSTNPLNEPELLLAGAKLFIYKPSYLNELISLLQKILLP